LCSQREGVLLVCPAPTLSPRHVTAHAPNQRSPLRTSGLQAPIMLLTGHAGEVFAAEFSPDGDAIASASFDRQIYMWRTFGDCENYAAMIGHAGAILDIHWSTDGGKLFTASSDKTCAVWDATTGERIRRLRGHSSIVNCCSPARASPMLASGSDDGTIKVRRFWFVLFSCVRSVAARSLACVNGPVGVARSTFP
jgi:Prp8 binding protein